MRDPTLKAYLGSVAAAATTTFLAFIWWSGLYSVILDLEDVAFLLLFWFVVFALMLVGTFIPAAVMVGLSQRLKLETVLYHVAWWSAASLLPACLVTWLFWSPDLPDDPDYLSFANALRRVALLFLCGGPVGGLTYWYLIRRSHSAPQSASGRPR